jgi:general secretion pathway protein E
MSSHATFATHEHRLSLAEILDVLVADGLVARADADALLAAQRRKAGEAHPLVVIAGQKWPSLNPPHRLLGLEELTEWLAGRVELDYLRIDPLKIDFAAVTGVMSSAYATRFGVLPIQVGLREVVVATTQPFLREWEKEVAGILKKEIRRVVASPADVARYLVEFYNLARSVKKAAQTSGAHGIGATSFEQLVDLGQGNRQFDANDRHIVNIVDWLWQYAFEQRASDIHIEPRRDMGLVRFRIDGVLHQVYQMPMSVLTAMTSRIKILGRWTWSRSAAPGRPHQDPRGQRQGGRAAPVHAAHRLRREAGDAHLRPRGAGAQHGRAGLFGAGRSPLAFDRRAAQRHHPGHRADRFGQDHHAVFDPQAARHPEVNVCTIEDPIEMVEPAFNQMQVHQAIDLGFAEGVRALMRQDPDIIMVGEIRDLQTAEMAIQAALTGHLVLSTLHTNDAPAALTRMLDLGVPAYLLNATVLGIMAQRLVRILCPHLRGPPADA